MNKARAQQWNDSSRFCYSVHWTKRTMTTRDKIRHAVVTYLQNGMNFHFYFLFLKTESQVDLAFVCVRVVVFPLFLLIRSDCRATERDGGRKYVEQTSGECTNRTISEHTHTHPSPPLSPSIHIYKITNKVYFSSLYIARALPCISWWRIANVFVRNGFSCNIQWTISISRQSQQSRA